MAHGPLQLNATVTCSFAPSRTIVIEADGEPFAGDAATTAGTTMVALATPRAADAGARVGADRIG